MAKCKLIRSSIPAKITLKNMHLAWSNPNPTSAFGSQNITLDISACPDYDYIKVFYFISTTDQSRVKSVDVLKGKGTYLEVAATSGKTINVVRLMGYISDNSLSFGEGYNATPSAQTTDNTVCAPYEIYIGKHNPTADVTAVASSVKTNAQNCMMSDGVTNVETVLNDKAYAKLDFTAITNAGNAKAFCTAVCADLARKITETNKMIFVGYVWAGVDSFIGYATVRTSGHLIGTMSSASATYATYNFDYTISSGSIRVTSIQGTQL